MKSYLYFLGFFLACRLAIAQPTDSTKLRVNISLNGNISEGNASRWILLNRLNIDYKLGSGFTSIEHSDYYIYGKVQGRRFENNILDRTFLNFNANGKLIPFVAFFLESYPVRNQKFRWQTGLGAKYKVIDKKGVLVQPGLMFSYSQQEFETAIFKSFENGNSNKIETTFITPVINVNMPLLKGKVVLMNNLWYQLDTSGDNNHRHFYDGRAIFKLTRAIGFQVIVTNYWENIVQSFRGAGPQGPPIEKNDFVLAYGITANFSR